MGHHNAVVYLGSSFPGRLGHDRLITFTMYHDLPFPFTQISSGFRVLHNRETPLLKLVHTRVNVASDVITQIFTDKTHEVVAGVADMVFRLVLVPLHTHVTVNCI